ncbi:hypothetical protein CVT25_008646 [Psilocybe cyanescens]|uniref:Ion channel n=1 Tax=Psilocybe cyanescens TaxID=93625 RepID=A0A409XNN4_PSICY|nr:hypothetical protein CVT25_008646 [Psilocybe cyanescens]
MSYENQWTPDSEGSQTTLLHEETELVKSKLRGAWTAFLEFALRDNVLEVSVGLIFASALTGVVNSLISDVMLPLVSLLPFMSRSLNEKFLVVKKGPQFTMPQGYNTRRQALDDGAVVLAYGAFIDQLVNFIGIGLVLYTLANIHGYISRDSVIKNTAKCTFCRKEISSKNMAYENQRTSEGARMTLLHDERELVKSKFRSAWTGFVQFALRDNVLEVAVGLIIATAFTSVVNSLVTDILLPPISLLPFMSRNLEEKFLVLRKGPHFTNPQGYNTRKQAVDDGAVVLTYGVFIDQFVNFIGIGLVLYTIANIYGYFSHDSIIRHTVKCTFCRKEISSKAKRCPMCTSWLDGREERETSALPPTLPGQA